jgi:hypothetical protein
MKFLTTLLFHLSMSQLGVISVGTLLDRRRWRPEVFTFYNIFIFWRRLTIRFCVRRRRARKHPLTVVVPPIFIFRCERRIYVDFCEGELLRRNTGDPFCKFSVVLVCFSNFLQQCTERDDEYNDQRG